MREIKLTSGELISALLRISETEVVCILDSCGVGHLGSHLLIAGVRPADSIEISDPNANGTLKFLDDKRSSGLAGIFTLSYDLGLKLQNISGPARPSASDEPDVYLSLFEVLIIHDYASRQTYLIGNEKQFDRVAKLIADHSHSRQETPGEIGHGAKVTSNFTRDEYVAAVERVREYIRSGDTYQTNLTQRLTFQLPDGTTPQCIFERLRRDHPAPFAAFLTRKASTVISASPERFFRIRRNGHIEASPIKGTRPRGNTPEVDARLRRDLTTSEKDRAENTMIVDLLRNDMGRVCEFGSVKVEKLCDIEEHPTLLHLVSTIVGRLRPDTKFSEIIQAVFPCGSITGAPKLRTMEIIGEIEPDRRGLSMGAIGCFLPEKWPAVDETLVDVSVAIRTMVIKNREGSFNVGGGIVIDSDPAKEYDESLLKAKALLSAIGAGFDSH
ncbi:MAG TPA: aminodeoxychorismate synthase component I [Pyrinomonadaceae bacterium]